ncbi:MAG: hypothetical protein C5B50_12625 [Verrucomicrobia bacterium]|nr:MAG: hypothetical protein C5B50_12625 [Verrucomicrobiota bacterium]
MMSFRLRPGLWSMVSGLWSVVRGLWSALASLCLLLLSAPSAFCSPGPGLNQVTWLPSEVGTAVYTFAYTIVGKQPTMSDFQHGYLIIESAHSLDDTLPGRDSWYDFSSPRAPRLLAQASAGGNKPHMIAFYGSRMIDGFQNTSFHIWDVENMIIVNTYSGTVNPVWYMCQAPYVFRPRNGYGTGANLMEIADISNGNGTALAIYDLGSAIPFAVGSSHAIGNLLVCSASQAAGVATFDISDPANPKLLGSLVTGNPVYTSMVHGSRVYQCETLKGIRVYDFSDPVNIRQVGFLPISGNPRYVMLKDGIGYCAPGAANIVVFNATNLTVLHNWTLPAAADVVQLIGNMGITGGNEGANLCALVPLQQAPDTSGPVVQYANPPDGSTSQAVSSRIGFVMSDHIDVLSLNTNTWIVRPLGSNAIPGTYSTQLGMINFAPAQPLLNNTTYEVILPVGGIRDVAGNGLAQPFSMRFTTGATIITTITNLLAEWTFENSGADVSGNGHTSTLANGATYSTNHVEGNYSLSLTGATTYATPGLLSLSNQFTIALWAYIPSGTTNIQTLLANSVGGSSANGFRFFVNSYLTADRKIVLETGNGTNSSSTLTPTNTVVLDSWNHIAAVVDRAAGAATLYYAGVPAGSGKIRTDFAQNAAVYLGAMLGPQYCLKGYFDDVRIYNRALATNEIAALAVPTNAPAVIQSFTVSTNAPLIGQQVTFSAVASDSDGDVLHYLFNFGDGSAGVYTNASAVAYAYSSPGRYSATVRVDDGHSTNSGPRILMIPHYALSSPSPAASSPIVYDPNRNKVWCVNPDSDTVSRIDANTFAKDLEIAVGKRPHGIALSPTATQLLIVCEDSNEIWSLNPLSGALITKANLGYGQAPTAIVFAPDGSSALVALRGAAAVLKVDPGFLSVTASCPLPSRPSSLAISGDGSRLFLTRFISPDTQGEIWEVAPSTMTLARTFPLAFDTTPDFENSGSGVPNYLLHIAIRPDGRAAWVPSKKDNIGRGVFRNGLPLTPNNSTRSILSQLDLVTNTENLAARIDVAIHSLAGSLRFSPLGDLAYVPYQGNEEVRVFDTSTGTSISSVTSTGAPQGVCLNPAGTRLYVMNFLARTISAFDVTGPASGNSSIMTKLGETSVVTTEKLSAQALAGKRMFYNASDPRMSAEGYISCIGCHLDADEDGRTWDFTDRGEGLRKTITMQGRRGMGHGFVHWSANFDEIQDFEGDIRNAFGGTGFMSDSNYFFGTRYLSLGTPKAGISPDLDALAAYVSSLTNYPASPYRQSDGSPTTAGANGRQHFLDLQCYNCHGGADFTDSSQLVLHDVGTLKPGSGNRLGAPLAGIDTPTLRGIWSTPPYLHDGSATNLADVFSSTNAPDGTPHSAFRTLTTSQQTELLEFLLELDGSEAAVPIVTNPPPSLAMAHGTGHVTVFWPANYLGYKLYSTPDLTVPPGGVWTPVTNTAQTGFNFQGIYPSVTGNQFFQLRSQ